MAPHKATPEQWDRMEAWRGSGDAFATCVLELRDRIAAMEAAANSSAGLTGSNHLAKPDSSPAPAGGLVEMVAEAIGVISTTQATASAAILAVAEWFDAIGYGATASILRQEVQRG